MTTEQLWTVPDSTWENIARMSMARDLLGKCLTTTHIVPGKCAVRIVNKNGKVIHEKLYEGGR